MLPPAETTHHEIWKYCQDIGKEEAEVPHNPMVRQTGKEWTI